MRNKKVVIVGGGAAGFFGAINYARLNPEDEVIIIEKGKNLLGKVKVSGGGRCNVTHSCFDPRELVKFYPRGSKALRGPFSKFQPGDTIGWFDERGVSLKTEDDGRMFPETNISQTIIDCFLKEAEDFKVKIETGCALNGLKFNPESENKWTIESGNGEINCDKILIASGSSPAIWDQLNQLGMNIVKPVPSLFTFNIKDARINDLPGVVCPQAVVKIKGSKLEEVGPVLVTHWGLSGPGIIKLSAWGARTLNDCDYKFDISVNWCPGYHSDQMIAELKGLKEVHSKKKIANTNLFDLPKRLWRSFLGHCQIDENKIWAEIPNKALNKLAETLCSSQFQVDGKSTFKEEFVTAGGVELNEIDFKTMESKKFPGLYFAGEVLNIDGVTGGFNFQAAWTTSWLAANSM